MNITNSIALLLCIFMSFSDIKAIDPISTPTDKKENKEIIIIQIDDDLDAQLSGLAEYAFNLYQKNDRGSIKITTYSHLENEGSVSKLVALLDDKGADKGDIVSIKRDLEVAQAYFTISVTPGPAVQ